MSEFNAPAAQYQQPEGPVQRRGNGFGIAALILGIITVVAFAIPFVNYVAIGTGVIGIVLAIVGLTRKGRPHGTSIAGLILSAIGMILAIIMVVVYAAIFFAASDAVDKSNKAAAAEHTVTYTVTGDSTDSTIDYSTYTDGASGSEEAKSAKLPWTKEEKITGSAEGLKFNSFTLSAMNGETGNEITCEIKVDGKVVSTQKSSGQYASATCTGSN
jgi:hypothetical protein